MDSFVELEMRRVVLSACVALAIVGAACSLDTSSSMPPATETTGADASVGVPSDGRDASAGELSVTPVVPAHGGKLVVTLRDGSVSLPSSLDLCRGACVDLVAVASGGQAPYTFRWDDGTTEAKRRVCAAQVPSVSVTVTDTAIDTAEFAHSAESASASVAVGSHACDSVSSDAGVPAVLDAGPKQNACVLPQPSAASCQLGSIHLPEDLTVDVKGSVRQFAAGMALPAGRYRIAYVDGCNTYGVGGGWTIHAFPDASASIGGCSVIAGDGSFIVRTPGTHGVLTAADGGDDSAYATYEECVAANCVLAPVDFDFAGGALGLLRDGVFIGAIDDSGGEDVGGRSPTFRLSRLDPCSP